MNKTIDRCYICNGKSRNLCPAAGKVICSVCCGSKRGSEINCSPDCAYSPFSIKGYALWLKTDSNLALKILRYIDQVYGEEHFRNIIRHMSFESGLQEAEHDEATAAGAAVYYILFVERDKDNQALADRWKANNWQGLNNDERVMMNYRFNSRATIIEIQKLGQL